jgi:hypothetical protein
MRNANSTNFPRQVAMLRTMIASDLARKCI